MRQPTALDLLLLLLCLLLVLLCFLPLKATLHRLSLLAAGLVTGRSGYLHVRSCMLQ